MDPTFEPHNDVSELLRAWNQGDEDAFNRLVPLIYDELKRRAHYHLRRERSDHTLETTALVHETYVRLTEQRALKWESRAQFYWLASETMRRILVDYARARNAEKRGGEVEMVPIDPALQIAMDTAEVDVLCLDEALNELASFDSQQAKIVQLRYFAGCSIEETAQLLDISITTVKRDWAMAKAWLKRKLRSSN